MVTKIYQVQVNATLNVWGDFDLMAENPAMAEELARMLIKENFFVEVQILPASVWSYEPSMAQIDQLLVNEKK